MRPFANFRRIDVTPSLIAAFWARVQRGDERACWIWLGTVEKQDGYGILSPTTGVIRAHRVSYAIAHGEIPQGALVLHHCDNRRCVNPSHLYAGTPAENVRDMVNRGRATTYNRGNPNQIFGSASGFAKLSEAQVREIISRLPGENSREIAGTYGVSPTTISDIRARRTWPKVWEEFD